MLDRYPLCHLTRAGLLRDLGRCQEAIQADEHALHGPSTRPNRRC
ncbi:hypothetical protein ACFVRD_39265 [Streptomyces sp. NPDC057908]